MSVPVLIVTHGAHSRALIAALTRFQPSADAAPLQISAIHGVSPDGLDSGVLAVANRTIESTRPRVVVEAIDDPVMSPRLAAHAIRHGASVVTMSAALIGAAGRALHALAAEHGVGFYTEAALGFDLPIGAILRTSLPGDTLRSVIAFLPVTPPPARAVMAHRAAALASAAFRSPTTAHDVAVDDAAAPHTALRPRWERRLVVGATRRGGTVHTEVFHALLPPTHPMAAASVRSGFVVEAAGAGTLVFTCSHRSSAVSDWALHSDLALATRAPVASPWPSPQHVRGGHTPAAYLVSCPATGPAGVHAVITALDHRDMTIRQLENSSGTLRMVVDSPSRQAIRTALVPLGPAPVGIERLQVTGAGDPSTWLRL
ncbi:hypothetical protein [Actinoplanes awajinensis]|uniref:Homoserine dehydrogenase n=1 Tax=Actinoplanes awajinensis subsp. mycoplanecinus TaxID=135947 RepID=A0A101JBZ1_9ACTN|nr:hypothetical protein [Actinoplanes awajinensis]KUL23963.1 hypothetical protein ADL15_44930 [Actinoplanes awajinensis subsp. mycoplanecinus]